MMTWEYNQQTGELRHNGEFIAQGYSGKGVAKNDPSKQHIRDNGPIPKGYWRIAGHNNNKSPWTLVLEPLAGTNTFGRDSFLIHGDNRRTVGDSSKGCIIINGAELRSSIFNSGDTVLVVR
ncbi:tlde1 domain-containing protein [Nissabacter archeti]|nr:tlde1 domain-containing protein [Nissabacter archeti]